MINLPEPVVRPTHFEVSLLPEGHVDYKLFAITIERRGERWAVTWFDSCLGKDGAWDDGVKPYGRGSKWLNSHRFDFETACGLARKAAPHVTVNGSTAKDVFLHTCRA